MRLSTFTYCLKEGMKNIGRNIWFSLASTAIISACIFLFCMFFALVANVQYMVKNAETTVGITVFFDENMAEADILAIGKEIAARKEIKETKYISAEEAWETFQKEYFKDAEELAEGFADDNPLAGSASYEIYLKDIADQDVIVSYLNTITGIRKINYSNDTASGLSTFNKMLGLISAVIIAILLAVAVFLISNTITVGISVRREEIGIMKLIGATDYFVRAPFVVEGIVIGLIGAATPLGILYVLYEKIILYIGDKFKFISNMIQFLSVDQVFHTLVPVALLLGVGIGFIGSRITIRKHLKV